jgi:hypothetical protein
LNREVIMKKQITTATLIGALLALVCLLGEQQSVAAFGGHRASTRATRATPSPFDRHLRYGDV